MFGVSDQEKLPQEAHAQEMSESPKNENQKTAIRD